MLLGKKALIGIVTYAIVLHVRMFCIPMHNLTFTGWIIHSVYGVRMSKNI